MAITDHDMVDGLAEAMKAGSDSVGRPHIAQVLVDKEYVGNAQEAFNRLLADGGLAYVPRHLPDTREAISWIRAAKGVPVLAHPRWTKCRGEALYRLCSLLKDDGLLGLEVFYSTHTRRETAQYLQVANQLGFVITGGSDFHGAAKPDIQVGKGRGNLKVPAALLEPLRKAAG